MRESILSFPEQFRYLPKIEQKKPSLRGLSGKKVVVAGMGGSHLAADLLKAAFPRVSLITHKDYGLPEFSSSERKNVFVIASSYSGNTEEVLSAYEEAKRTRIPAAVIASGGKLLQRARRDKVPFICLPSPGIQPRMATGYSLRALFCLLGMRKELKESERLTSLLRVKEREKEGRKLARTLKGKIPLVYSSRRNFPVAYNWKIAFNETGKIPAFCNFFPELNHNEMAGFSGKKGIIMGRKFSLLFLEDADDASRIKKRMKVFEKLMRDRSIKVHKVPMRGKSRLSKIFSSLLLANWTAFFLAGTYGHEPEQVPIVEDFKTLL